MGLGSVLRTLAQAFGISTTKKQPRPYGLPKTTETSAESPREPEQR